MLGSGAVTLPVRSTPEALRRVQKRVPRHPWRGARGIGGAEPGEGDGDVGGAATGQGPQRELVGAGPDGVGEGVGDTLAEDGDADGGLGSGAMVPVCLSQEERGSRRAPEWVA